VLNKKTIDGLDDALSELLRAIEALPPSTTKKGLMSRFENLQQVRGTIDSAPPTRAYGLKHLLAVVVVLGVIAWLFWPVRRCPDQDA